MSTRRIISLSFSLAIIVMAYFLVGKANEWYFVDGVCINEKAVEFYDALFFVSIPLYSFLTANTLVGIFNEKKEWLLAAFFRLTSVLAFGAVIDELFSSNPTVATHGEWFFATLSVVMAILEYNNVKPLYLLCYIKDKIWHQIR